jgi:hypothetical protein
MDAPKPKSKALDSTLRFVFSLTHGVLLLFFMIIVYALQPEGVFPSLWLLLATIPLVSFVIGLLLNALIQYLACSKLNGSQIALDSLFGPALTSFTLFLLWLIPALESPVLTVLPITLNTTYKKAVSGGFYVFWAGIYAQVIASGFVQVC